jgi:hypothetical protein
MWGLEEGWKETDKTHGRFCEKILQIPRFVAKTDGQIRDGKKQYEGQGNENSVY